MGKYVEMLKMGEKFHRKWWGLMSNMKLVTERSHAGEEKRCQSPGTPPAAHPSATAEHSLTFFLLLPSSGLSLQKRDTWSERSYFYQQSKKLFFFMWPASLPSHLHTKSTVAYVLMFLVRFWNNNISYPPPHLRNVIYFNQKDQKISKS